jgi:hypothetical protein
MQSHLAGMGEDGRAVALQMLVEAQAKASFGQHTSKRGLAHFPIQLNQVESVEDGVTDKLAKMAWAMMARVECYKESVALAA